MILVGCSSAEVASGTEQRGDVVTVVDGDTIKVRTATGDDRVRIIGIDTPEIGRDGKRSDCYADAARDYLDSLVYGRTVTLTSDPSQGDRDRYDRLLRHVDVDGVNVALSEIRDGMGREYTYDTGYAGQADYRAAEGDAKAAARGFVARY